MSFQRERIRHAAAELAAQRVYIGTSSWKYQGWLGQLYSRSRYEYRKKFAASRFERDCLEEYGEIFKTVCVDAAYYDFPRREYLERMANAVPADFRFGLKVTDAITLRTFPNLPRFATRAGQANRDFLNADLFATAFLNPCEHIRAKIGVLMFEFSRFWPHDYTHGKDFVADLDRFLAALPRGWPYGVELRNEHFLQPEYFNCLARHGVTHVFNSWQAMPSISEQIALPGSVTQSDRAVARFLLKPGRKYEDAVQAFQPYDRVKEVNIDARQAGEALIKTGRAKNRETLIFVNNRLEGNALDTIAAMIELAYDGALPEPPPAKREPPLTLF